MSDCLPKHKVRTWCAAVFTLTNGANDAGVACSDWLLVNVQQTEMLQEGVGHAGVQLLALDKRIRQCHHV